MQDSDIEPFGKNVFQGLEVFWSAGALVALCRCFGCAVPVLWLRCAGALVALCRCFGCTVPLLWLHCAGA